MNDYVELPEERWASLRQLLKERMQGWTKHITPAGHEYFTKPGMVMFSTMQDPDNIWDRYLVEDEDE